MAGPHRAARPQPRAPTPALALGVKELLTHTKLAAEFINGADF